MTKEEIKYKRWYPKCGERYYFISQSGTVSSTRAGTSKDYVWRYYNFNVFKSYKHCQSVLRKKLLLLGIPFHDVKDTGSIMINTNEIFMPKLELNETTTTKKE